MSTTIASIRIYGLKMASVGDTVGPILTRGQLANVMTLAHTLRVAEDTTLVGSECQVRWGITTTDAHSLRVSM